MPLVVGTHVGQFDICAVLGAGAMGEVYAAVDPRLGRKIALKVLPAEFADDPERAARFEREARAVAALNHPNIVTVHSVERLDGVHVLTMELVEGRTLANVIPNTDSSSTSSCRSPFRWRMPSAPRMRRASPIAI